MFYLVLVCLFFFPSLGFLSFGTWSTGKNVMDFTGIRSLKLKVFFCFCFIRSSGSVLLSSRKPAVSKLGKWRNILYTGVASLAVGGGLCAVPFKQVSRPPCLSSCYKLHSSIYPLPDLLYMFMFCVFAAGWTPFSWLPNQKSSLSGDRQLKHFSLSDQSSTNRCHHRVRQSKSGSYGKLSVQLVKSSPSSCLL